MAQLSLKEFHQLLAIIQKRIEFEVGNGQDQSISFSSIAYRTIAADDMDITSTESPVSGDLEDDITELKKLLTDSNRFCSIVDLERFAMVLLAISREFYRSE